MASTSPELEVRKATTFVKDVVHMSRMWWTSPVARALEYDSELLSLFHGNLGNWVHFLLRSACEPQHACFCTATKMKGTTDAQRTYGRTPAALKPYRNTEHLQRTGLFTLRGRDEGGLAFVTRAYSSMRTDRRRLASSLLKLSSYKRV
eukprot:1155000-Pelagomonas_calceolata.AAC.6